MTETDPMYEVPLSRLNKNTAETERLQLALRDVTARAEAAEAAVARALARHEHADTCDAVLLSDADDLCNCWRAALSAAPSGEQR